MAALAAALVSLTLAGSLDAQAPSVTAQVDRSRFTTDDVILLTVEVEGGNQVSRPRLPLLDGLAVIGTSSISQISITDGRMVSNFLFEYSLAATRTGDLVVGPIAVSVDGVQHLTDPIELSVTGGTGRLTVPTPAPDFDFGNSSAPASLIGQEHFFEAGVDDATPYLGQQVTYHQRYYRAHEGSGAVTLVRRSYEPPSFSGFWHRDLSDGARYETTVAGRLYVVLEERTVLFPTLVGRLAIEPAVMTVSEGLGRASQVLVSDEVAVDVRPLPPGAPDGFDGAVGDYVIEARVASARLKGGDPARVTVTVRGSGNVDALPPPRIPSTPDWRIFPQGSDSSSQVVRGVLRGSKVFEFTLLPNIDGALEIPSFEYVYFDPAAHSYVTLATDPIAAEVEPGSIGRPIDPVAGTPAGPEQPAADLPVDGVWPIRPLTEPISTGGGGLAGSLWFLVLIAFPALIIIGFELIPGRGMLAGALSMSLARRRPAQARVAAPGLSPVRRLEAHLSALLGRSVAGWSSERLGRELADRGIAPDLVSAVRRVIEIDSARRFAPPGMRPDDSDDSGDPDNPDNPDNPGYRAMDLDELLVRLDQALR